MKLVKRYALFLLLFAGNLALFLFLPDLGRTSLSNMWDNFKEMIGVIPPIFILLGLLDVWVDRGTMIRFTGEGSGLKGALLALFLGSAAAGPLYAAFPVASVMLKKGSSLTNVFLFIGAWSTTKIPMLTFEATNMGLPFTLVRLGLSLIGITLIALGMNALLTGKDRDEVYALNRDA
jgi:uncharacterized membrane protein YraQ (UPF0718 family)